MKYQPQIGSWRIFAIFLIEALVNINIKVILYTNVQ